ncbi:MAG: iron ABC transporter substrate-binding protein [Candidatus Bathyarchaeota archaeon]|nr:iron ABC transporter substrate-binding protein [Candidatus Bathyarchaeota archaeon]
MVKKTHLIAVIAVVAVILVAAIAVALTPNLSGNPEQEPETQEIVDMAGRTVTVPTEINRVVAVCSGCLRVLTYMDAADLICAVEETESDPTGRPYAMAHPEYASLPVIGPGHGGDPELIAAQNPDVIFCSDARSPDFDGLQAQTGIPVVCIVYGGLDTADEIQTFYDGLTLVGQILHKEDRATEVINYFNDIIDDLDSRTSDIPDSEKVSVYVGGLSSGGKHGIVSTNAYYAPFTLTNSKNVITDEMVDGSTSVVSIDAEIIPSLNPDIIFIDYYGLSLCQADVADHADVYGDLDAIKNNCTYGLIGYNWYHLNYGMVLTDAYYVGRVLYPDQFSDVDPEEKADEIYTFLVGAPCYDELAELYAPFGPVSLR